MLLLVIGTGVHSWRSSLPSTKGCLKTVFGLDMQAHIRLEWGRGHSLSLVLLHTQPLYRHFQVGESGRLALSWIFIGL